MNTSGSAPPLDRSIAFALLASGGARRFGGGKLFADLGGRPLWRWATDTAEVAGFGPRFLIASERDAPVWEHEAEGWTICVNRDAAEGIASSIRAACRVAAQCRRLVIGLADMPFVDPAHLRTLASAKGAAFTRYPSGREGVPAAFPSDCFAALDELRGDRGAAALSWAGRRAILQPPSQHTLFDVDTAEDLDRARGLVRLTPKSVRSSASSNANSDDLG